MLSPGCAPLLRTDPRSIDRYRITGRLGAGGMASVYLAEDAGSFVALKLVHEHLAADAEFRARFERETQLAARVPAHCTAALKDTGVYDDRPYLVTEYLVGTPLHRLVEDEGPLDPASLHNIAVGMAAGLTAIHDCDLVHRDIKPSNVVVTRGGVRIIDFGIARTLDTTTDFTQSGVVMGSLGWTSPEQLDGRGPEPAMDVFAWGCVVAYAATGRHPFGGEDTVSRSWRILNAEPDLAGVPKSVADLVGAALDRDSERRPSAQELLLGLVGGAGPVVKVRAAVPPASGAGSVAGPAAEVAVASVVESGRVQRRRRWTALLLGAVPIGLATAIALAPTAGSGGVLDRLNRPESPSSSVPGAVSPTPSEDRPVSQPNQGLTRTPDATGDTGTATAAGDQGESGDPGDGAETTDATKPKKSKKPKG
jgi:predicted Ser/Thr protein kinase